MFQRPEKLFFFAMLVNASVFSASIVSAAHGPRVFNCHQPNTSQRAVADQTNILFSVIDGNERFVATLSKEDIRVMEDDIPQEIQTLQRRTNWPASIAILIDTSGSQERLVPGEKVAAKTFVDLILHSGQDQVAIVSFTGEATVEQDLTTDLARVHAAIERIKFVPPPGYVGGGVVVSVPSASGLPNDPAFSTAIWDVISSTCEGLFTPASRNRRRALVLLTDGEDTSSKLRMREAIERAIRGDVAVYAIGLADKKNFGAVNKEALRKVTERTGGRAFFPKKTEDVAAAFGEIEQELRSQYLIGYTPISKKPSNSFRKVRIEVINPELRKLGVRVIHQDGYYVK